MANSTHGNSPTRARKGNWQRLFLSTLGQSANVSLACEVAHIDRSTAYKERSRNPVFRDEWDGAMDDAIDALEAEAWRRAKDGVEKPVFQGGKQVGAIREYSDTLMVTLLKAHRPEKYRENFKVETTSTASNGAITAPTDLVAYVHSALPGFLAAIHKPGA